MCDMEEERKGVEREEGTEGEEGMDGRWLLHHHQVVSTDCPRRTVSYVDSLKMRARSLQRQLQREFRK